MPVYLFFLNFLNMYTHTCSRHTPWAHSKSLGRFQCSGSEIQLDDCKHSTAECDGEYASVICSTEAQGSILMLHS